MRYTCLSEIAVYDRVPIEVDSPNGLTEDRTETQRVTLSSVFAEV